MAKNEQKHFSCVKCVLELLQDLMPRYAAKRLKVLVLE